MNTFSTILLDEEMTFPRLGEVNPLETFSDYAVHCLTNVAMQANLEVTYCLISGFPTGFLHRDEMSDLIRAAVVALELDRIGATVERPTDSEVGMAFEMILDHVATRVIETSRPAPSLTFSRGRLAIANAHWTRQLAVLISTLLYDAGQLRDRDMRYTDKVMRIQATIEMAKYIRSLESTAQIDELFSALIELDAKYSIRNLTFTRKEGDKLAALRAVGVPTIESIHEFALSLLAHRDQHSEIIEDGMYVWTREVYMARTFNAVDRREHSNLWKQDTSDPKRYTPEARAAAKRGRPVNPEVQARKAEEAKAKEVKNKTGAFDSAWDSLFVKKA